MHSEWWLVGSLIGCGPYLLVLGEPLEGILRILAESVISDATFALILHLDWTGALHGGVVVVDLVAVEVRVCQGLLILV